MKLNSDAARTELSRAQTKSIIIYFTNEVREIVKKQKLSITHFRECVILLR